MSDALTLPPPGLAQARLLAVLAMLVAVSAPFWAGHGLGLVGLQTPVAARLAALRDGADAEDRRLAALHQRIDAALAEVGRSRAEAAQIKLVSWSSVIALSDLAAMLHKTEPFDKQFAIARAVALLPDDISKLLDRIAPYAATGVPDSDRISRDFAARAARLGYSGKDYAPVAMVKQLLTWSSQQLSGDAAPSDETHRRLAQASDQLAAGDTAGAVATVGQFAGPAREVFSGWVEDATARAAADRLARQVALLLGGGPPAGAGARP
jgi:hypothetical protein